MKKKKKLLIVAAFPPIGRNVIGGIEKSTRIMMQSKLFKDFKLIKFDTSQVSNPPPNFFIRFFRALQRLLKFVFTLFIDRPNTVLIFCSDGASALEKGIMIILSRLFNAKSLIFPRAGNLINQTQNNKLFMSIIKFLFSRANFFLCQGPTWYKYAINDLKIDKSRVDIIANWTATEELIQIGRKRLITNKNSLEILFVGWLEKQKGIIELLQAFQKLQKKYQIRIKFIGNGALKKKIELYSIEHNLNNHITTTGWLNDDEIILHLKSADIFVLPSWQEGMPNSLIEALASGLPSICSSVGVIPDYIRNDFNGLLVDPKNQVILENTLEKTIKNIELRKKLSKNAVFLAEKTFSSRETLKKLVGIIETI